MIAAAQSRRGVLCFCFANPAGFSGQKAATELVLHGLAGRGWHCEVLSQPVLDRARAGAREKLRYAGALLSAWLAALRLLRPGRAAGLWLGLGQTRVSFVRDAVPLLVGRWRLGREHVVVALNGSLFMRWTDHSWDARMFRFLLGHAGTVTVVGEQQRTRLLGFGVPRLRVEVVVNSCALEPLTIAAVERKQAPAGTEPLRCLYLSSLIDTKGYPEYLEALLEIGARAGRPIEAVLCGRVVVSEFADRFRDGAMAEAWIREIIERINRSGRVRACWIDGAAGAEKAALLRAAHLFVLPTRYPVEAQPLALLEAMASGCAIVTTAAGEIPTILDSSCAELLAEVSPPRLAQAIERLVDDDATRSRLATAAQARFVERYSVDRHLDHWETLLARRFDGAEEAS